MLCTSIANVPNAFGDKVVGMYIVLAIFGSSVGDGGMAL